MIFLYRSLLIVLGPFYFLTVFFSKKTRAYLTKRPQYFDFDTRVQKTIWIHASSGEFEHAKFLIKSFKEKHPHKKLILTYSSPSYVYAIQKNKDIDAYLPLPFDARGPVSSIIKKINPEVVLFSRTDVWPELAHQLQKKKIPSLLFARAENSKTGFLKKIYYKMTFLKLSHISFVSERDKGRFISLLESKASTIRLSVDGDPRVDEVFDKITESKYSPINQESDTSIILGSVWKEDLDVIKNPLIEALRSGRLSKIIAAPHDPDLKQIEELKKAFKGFPIELYSKAPNLEPTVTIVDKVGVLFDLYSEAKLAFIGGSFKEKVHSVIEPLAKGLPTLTGPKINNNSEAVTYSKKPYEFVKICKDESSFSQNLDYALTENNLEIQESILLQKGSSNKILEHIGF